MATRCLLVADDLTGAADACAKFVGHGYSGTVVLGLDAAVAETSCSDVVSVNTDTRRLSPVDAASRVRETERLASGVRGAEVFKKVDSTLRGHVGAEIEAALQAFRCTHAIVAPAFPAMGRTVREGWLVAREPGGDVTCDIVALLREQGAAGAATVPRPDRSSPDGTEVIRGAIARALDGRARVLVFDAGSDADLREIVAAARTAGGRPLWVGSAGLADALAAHLAGAERPKAVPLRIDRTAGSVLLCIGSSHPATRAQVALLVGERDVGVIESAGGLGRSDRDLRRPRRMLLVDLAAGPHGRDALETARAAIVHEALSGMVLSGGDTAADVCAALGATAIRIGGEVATGIPWGVLQGGDAHGLAVVLKAGGFGTERALVAAVDFLSGW